MERDEKSLLMDDDGDDGGRCVVLAIAWQGI